MNLYKAKSNTYKYHEVFLIHYWMQLSPNILQFLLFKAFVIFYLKYLVLYMMSFFNKIIYFRFIITHSTQRVPRIGHQWFHIFAASHPQGPGGHFTLENCIVETLSLGKIWAPLILKVIVAIFYITSQIFN